MKGLTLTLTMILLSLAGFSQTTYFWIGGTGLQSFTDNSKWNTQLDGLGTTRVASAPDDVLIFDGSNFGGITPITGNVIDTFRSTAMGQLFLQNSANVTLDRTNISGTTGTTALTINGDGTAADDFIVSANSTLTIRATTTGYGMNVIVGILSTNLATARIYGTVNITDGGFATTRITAPNPGSVKFDAGAVLNVTNSFASNYPFATGSSSPAQASLGAEFMAGSKAVLLTGNTISVNGNTSTFNPIKWDAGSLLQINATALPAGMFNSKTLANVTLKSPVSYTLAENFYNIDTLTIESGATFNFRVTGGSPISGDIINNGTFGAAVGFTSGNLALIGAVPQTVGGTGTFNNLSNIYIGADANVTVNKNIAISGTSSSSVLGSLNMGTNTLSGTGNFQTRSAATATTNGTTVLGTNAIVLDNTVYNGSTNNANVVVGALVSGTGIPANTYIIATNSGTSTITVSRASTAAGLVPVTITTNAPTLQTANTAGVDGTILTTGVTRSFSSGTNFIFDAATTTPFAASTTNSAGNVIFNAAVTTNKISQSISGTLTLNSGNVTIRSTDTIRVTSGNSVAGTPFSSSKYIISQGSGNNLGVLRIDNLPTTTTLFPVGTASYYLPVSLTPVTTGDYAVSVFEGVTEDGTPTGTAFSAAKKADVVDAVWIIDRPTGSGDCITEIGWDAALEGTSFTNYTNANIGISHYDGPNWGNCLGTGDNVLNTSTALYSIFSPFGVGYNGAILATQVKNISAFIKTGGVEINWDVANEAGIVSYQIEKSLNQAEFIKVGTVDATGKNKYVFTDAAAFSGVIYYRIKIIGITGEIKYTEIVSVKMNGKTEINLYPNPVINNVTISGITNGSYYRIMNGMGQVVTQQKTNANSLSIDVSKLQGGLYFIEIISNDNTKTKRSFIKQ